MSSEWPSPGNISNVLGTTEVVQRVVEQVVFGDGHADVIAASDHVSGSANFVDLEDGGFVVIAFGLIPGKSAEKIGIVAWWCRRCPSWRCVSTAPAPVTAAFQRVLWVMSQLVM